MDYAVIRSGGKQYRVSPGDTLRLEKLAGEPGAACTFEVLLASAAGAVDIGRPLVEGTRVVGEIVRHEKAKKILVFKKKRRKNYRRKRGHRQELTIVRVKAIERGREGAAAPAGADEGDGA
jgi:large subunit ribosomal protein L21